MFVHSFSHFLYVYYVCIKFFACENHLVFPSVYLVLVYHKYTNATIGPWWVRTQLNVFSTSKQPNTWNWFCILSKVDGRFVMIILWDISTQASRGSGQKFCLHNNQTHPLLSFQMISVFNEQSMLKWRYICLIGGWCYSHKLKTVNTKGYLQTSHIKYINYSLVLFLYWPDLMTGQEYMHYFVFKNI